MVRLESQASCIPLHIFIVRHLCLSYTIQLMATYSYMLLTSKINKRRSLLHLIMLYNKKKTSIVIIEEFHFTIKELYWLLWINILNIAYLKKPAYCYIEAVNLRSNNINGSWKSLPIPAALLYIALYSKQHTPNVISCSREICCIHKIVPIVGLL